jgi:hypothetical protein
MTMKVSRSSWLWEPVGVPMNSRLSTTAHLTGGYSGSNRYDDEGVRSNKTPLITDGILTGRLHSRETAGKMGEEVNRKRPGR